MARNTVRTDKTEEANQQIASVVEPVKGGEKVLFISNGNMSVVFSETRKFYTKTDENGRQSVTNIPAKRLIFDNRMAETTDAETIEAAMRHKSFGVDFFFHPKYVPEEYDGKEPKWWESRHEIAKRFLGESASHHEEMKQRRIAAKSFDKNSNPENGLPVTKDEDKIIGW